LGSAIGLFNILVSKDGYSGGVYTLFDISIFCVLSLFFIPNPGLVANDMFPLNIPAWSLFFEILGNMVFFVIYSTVMWDFIKVALSIVAVILALLIFSSPEQNIGYGTAFTDAHFAIIRVGYSFFVGAVIYDRFRICSVNRTINGALGVYIPYLSLVVVAAVLVFTPSKIVRPYFDFLVVTCVFPLVVYTSLFYQPIGIGARIFKFAGTISYPIYILHVPLIHLFYGVLKKVFGVSAAEYAPVSGLIFLFVLTLICHFVVKYYDMPIRAALTAARLSRSLAARRDGPRRDGQ
jgi:peptidoglycan/LPS O-acetylase OafA/YrhL